MRYIRSFRTRLQWLLFVTCTVLVSTLIGADDDTYVSQWGPAVGDQLPDLTVKNSNGESRTFDELKGENGLVLVFVRSSDW